MFFTPFNEAEAHQDSVGRSNIRLRYTSPDDQWYVEGYGENLTDENVLTSALRSAGTLGYNLEQFLDPPRTYGIRIGFDL